MRRAPAGRQRAARSRRCAGPAAMPDRRGRERVVDGQPAEGRDRRRTDARRSSTRSNAIPAAPARRRRRSARTSASVREAVGQRRARAVRPAIAPDPLVVRVEDRHAVRGQRLDQLALGPLDGLDRPDPRQVDRLDRRDDADLGPRRSRARSAISPPTYMPISRTAARCSGPRRRTVSGRPISLFWLPSLRRVGSAAPRTAATASLVEVLAMLARDPDDERVEPRVARPSRAAWSARSGIGRPGRPWRRGRRAGASAGGPRDEDRRGARRRAPRRGSRGRRSARPAGPRTGCPASTARESTAPPRIGRPDRAEQRSRR